MRQCASPRNIRREELLEHSDGGAAAPQVGLLDDHRPRPRQRIDNEQLDSLRPRVGLLIGQLAGSELNVYSGAAPRVRKDGTAAAVERVWTLWADLDARDADVITGTSAGELPPPWGAGI